MALKFPKKYYLIFVIVAVLSAMAVYWATSSIIKEEKETRTQRLEQINSVAALEVSDALSNYVTLISGIRAETKFADSFPSQEELFKFIKYQISDLSIDKSFVISYVDTSHTFKYSFVKDQINPSGMIGKKMKDIVGNKGMRNLDKMMEKDEFYAFEPFNLVEGRVGLPIGFGVLDKQGESIGYFSIVTDFKPLIDKVYNKTNQDEVVFRFTSSKGTEFDRERVYDGNEVNNPAIDSEYYKNFDIKETAFIKTTIPFYNKSFTISTAYKEEYQYSSKMFIISGLWYIGILGFMLFIISQLYLYEKKNKVIAQQKEQLSELIATKNKFFSIIAHDLRSPLSSVVNFLDVLKQEKFDNSQTNQILNALEDSSRNSITLLDNLLKWSKVQTGNIKYEPIALDVLGIIKDQIKVLSNAASKKGINVRVESSFSGKFLGDKNMIGSLVRNLLSNAIKFSKENSVVVIELSAKNNQLSLTIEDSGIGIPKPDIPKLFEPSEVTTQVGTFNEKGSGLGLLLCNQFVKTHRGTIHIESTLNKGTIVSCLFPLS